MRDRKTGRKLFNSLLKHETYYFNLKKNHLARSRYTLGAKSIVPPGSWLYNWDQWLLFTMIWRIWKKKKSWHWILGIWLSAPKITWNCVANIQEAGCSESKQLELQGKKGPRAQQYPMWSRLWPQVSARFPLWLFHLFWPLKSLYPRWLYRSLRAVSATSI